MVGVGGRGRRGFLVGRCGNKFSCRRRGRKRGEKKGQGEREKRKRIERRNIGKRGTVGFKHEGRGKEGIKRGEGFGNLGPGADGFFSWGRGKKEMVTQKQKEKLGGERAPGKARKIEASLGKHIGGGRN